MDLRLTDEVGARTDMEKARLAAGFCMGLYGVVWGCMGLYGVVWGWMGIV